MRREFSFEYLSASSEVVVSLFVILKRLMEWSVKRWLETEPQGLAPSLQLERLRVRL